MNSKQIRHLSLVALFVALIFLLGFTPIGLIPLGFINLTILCIPVVIGAMYFGLKTGLLLGFFFGLVSLMRALGISGAPSSLVGTLLGKNVLLVVVLCLLPRMLVPLTTSLTYRALHKANHTVRTAAAAIVGSLTNTVFYLGLMLLFYQMAGLDAAPVTAIITGTGLLGGGCEAVAAAILAVPILAALNKVSHRKS